MSMSAKKRVNGSWVNTTLRQHKTATDTITTFPAVLYTTGTTATVGLKCQTVQSGTPSPTPPIMPKGCGERTGNLFKAPKYKSKTQNGVTWESNGDGTITVSGVASGYSTFILADAYQIPSDFVGQKLTFNYRIGKVSNIVWDSIVFFNENNTVVDRYSIGNSDAFTIEIESNFKKVTVNVKRNSNHEVSGTVGLMINEGSTALPYEPYGYKILISSANTTTPVYLGEVETTRRIKKQEVKIERVITLGNGNKGGVTKRFSGEGAKPGFGLCDRALYGASSVIGGFYINQLNAVFIGSSTDTLDDFKTKYNGASLWYVLETEETGIVNEPLMKIGDYADEVSNISIPTITGKNIVDVETVLKPSEVSFNYAGWHNAVVHKRINGAWD